MNFLEYESSAKEKLLLDMFYLYNEVTAIRFNRTADCRQKFKIEFSKFEENYFCCFIEEQEKFTYSVSISSGETKEEAMNNAYLFFENEFKTIQRIILGGESLISELSNND